MPLPCSADGSEVMAAAGGVQQQPGGGGRSAAALSPLPALEQPRGQQGTVALGGHRGPGGARTFACCTGSLLQVNTILHPMLVCLVAKARPQAPLSTSEFAMGRGGKAPMPRTCHHPPHCQAGGSQPPHVLPHWPQLLTPLSPSPHPHYSPCTPLWKGGVP